jgi:hypothetical protein
VTDPTIYAEKFFAVFFGSASFVLWKRLAVCSKNYPSGFPKKNNAK